MPVHEAAPTHTPPHHFSPKSHMLEATDVTQVNVPQGGKLEHHAVTNSTS